MHFYSGDLMTRQITVTVAVKLFYFLYGVSTFDGSTINYIHVMKYSVGA